MNNTPESSEIIEQLKIGDAIGDIEWNAYTVRGIFLLLVRLQYSNADHYGTLKEKLKNFVWSKSPTAKLHIDYDYNYDAKNLSKRPAIFVGVDDVKFMKKVLDNSKDIPGDGGAEEFIKIAATNVIIRHVGSSPDEALQLSTLSTKFFLALQKMMKEQVKLYQYEVSGIKSSRPFETTTGSSEQSFVSDLIIEIQFQVPWLIIRESHRIRTFDMRLHRAEFTMSE